MNKFITLARLTKDPDIRCTTSGERLARFSIAVDRRFKKDGEPTADFFNCVAFKGTADFMEKYCRKGQRYLFDGEMRNNNYEKDGKTVYSDQYVVNTVEFADGKAEEKKTDGQSVIADGDFMAVPDTIDEELPFN